MLKIALCYYGGVAETCSKYYKRAVFPKGEQKLFLKNIRGRLGLNLSDIAKISQITTRSLVDWNREKFSISLPAVKRLCRVAKIPLPKNIEIKEPFWYTSKGASLGWITVYKKYGYVGGDPEYRKRKWREWWNIEGKFKKYSITNTLPVVLPSPSSKFAEFIGILLGDGGITNRQITITLNKIDDFEFATHVEKLIHKLFNIKSTIRERDKIINIIISRTALVRFLVNNGLCIGSKVRHQIDIPIWIKNSHIFAKSCIKGLFDTDGCFYVDKHKHKDKTYYNCAMNFTNRSLPILLFFKEKLEKLGFHPTQKTKFSIFLRREDEIIKYFDLIGSSNSKHINKFKQYFTNKNGGVPKWS